uniref:Transporter n=1 Tax=Acanthochromis polyacanthus TaxID=80966 RepID=A0A3Q1EXR0_9TELE
MQKKSIISLTGSQDTHVDNGDENPDRGNWTNKTEYILSMIGYAVGLGNIWRFPYMAYKNGGGAFLIPYFLMLVLCGIPLLFLESAIGQFCSQGPINMWRAVPVLQGHLYYMFASMQFPLPWSSCSSWADRKCSNLPKAYCNVSGVLMTNWTQENITCPSSNKITVSVESPSEQYWEHQVIRKSESTSSSDRVVYFTATFPYLVILILLIRGVTLEGARDGIDFYIGSQSNLTKLTEGQVWKDAATQTFFSLSIAWGGVPTLASYSNFHNNMFLDSVVVTVINDGTSVFAGFAIFSILGHMAHVYGKPIGNVVKEGFGLAFIAYPDALAKLPISPLWSILFFFMLLTVGLDSQFAAIEVITTCLLDAFPNILTSKRAVVTILTCVIVFLLGLPCVTRAGIYWVTLIDQFVASWVMLILALMEITGFCYIYGVNRFIKDIEMMIGKKSFCFWLWWRACWLFLTPCIIVILVWSLVIFVPPTYGKVEYPAWGLALGWCMVAFILIWIPVITLYKVIKAKRNLCKVISLCSPSEEWHPYLDIHRGERYSKNMAAEETVSDDKTEDKKM